MKGEYFRPCPKCGRLCSNELDMCEICSGKIAKTEPKQSVVSVAEPETAPTVEETVAEETVVEGVAAEETTVQKGTVATEYKPVVEEIKTEDTVNREIVAETEVKEEKTPNNIGRKAFYAIVAVLMVVIVSFVVVIMRGQQPTIESNKNSQRNSLTTNINEAIETENSEKILSGHYKVGADISPGTYILFADEKTTGYICVSSDSNGDDIIFNENFGYNCIITINEGQYIELNRAYALTYSDGISLNSDGEGFFKVGVHIKAGEYKLTSKSDQSGYYAIYDMPLCGDEDIISNKNFDNDCYVTVKEGQYLLLNRCSAKFIRSAVAETTTKKTTTSSNIHRETTTSKETTTLNRVTTTKPTTPSFPSNVKTYSGYPYAPDFGATVGISYDEKYDSEKYSQTSYAYSVEKVMAVDPNAQSGKNYTELLYKCGYEYQGVVTVSGVQYQSFYHKESKTRIRYGLATEINSIVVIVAYV